MSNGNAKGKPVRAAPDDAWDFQSGGGRGGIRTHGRFLADARFRVECLKPDSATLPFCKIDNSVDVRRRYYETRASDCKLALQSCGDFGEKAPVFGLRSHLTRKAWKAKKCYKFWLAFGPFCTASCISAGRKLPYLVINRRHPVLTGCWLLCCLVNQSYSQVLTALSCHDST